MKRAACVLIKKEDKILGVARRDNPNDFGLPGGKTETEETPIQSAVRELQEETGLITTESNLIEIFSAIDNSGKEPCYCITFLAKSYTGDPKQGDAGEVKWCTEQELMQGTFGKYNTELFLEQNKLNTVKSELNILYGKHYDA